MMLHWIWPDVGKFDLPLMVVYRCSVTFNVSIACFGGGHFEASGIMRVHKCSSQIGRVTTQETRLLPLGRAFVNWVVSVRGSRLGYVKRALEPADDQGPSCRRFVRGTAQPQ